MNKQPKRQSLITKTCLYTPFPYELFQELDTADPAVKLAAMDAYNQFTTDYPLQSAATIDTRTIPALLPDDNSFIVLPEGTPRTDRKNALVFLTEAIRLYADNCYVNTTSVPDKIAGKVNFRDNCMPQVEASQNAPERHTESAHPLQVSEYHHQQPASVCSFTRPQRTPEPEPTPEKLTVFVDLCTEYGIILPLKNPYHFRYEPCEAHDLWEMVKAYEPSQIERYIKANYKDRKQSQDDFPF